MEGRNVDVERQIDLIVSHSELTQIAQGSKREECLPRKRLFKEKGIQYVWDGTVPNLKKVSSQKRPGGFGSRFGGKPPGGGKKSRPPRDKTKSTPQS